MEALEDVERKSGKGSKRATDRKRNVKDGKDKQRCGAMFSSCFPGGSSGLATLTDIQIEWNRLSLWSRTPEDQLLLLQFCM